MTTNMHILVVCLGNICRSPIAEGILKSLRDEHRLPWTIDSAGTSDWHHGDPPDRRSIAICKKYGVDISGQRSRQIQPQDLDTFDLILAMDKSNYENILELASNAGQRGKVRMIMDYLPDEKIREVPDPYFDGGFESVYELLDRTCQAFVSAHVDKTAQKAEKS